MAIRPAHRQTGDRDQMARQGFGLYRRWKSQVGKPGRPRVDPEIRELIRHMSRESPLWCAPRIVDELALLGVHVAKSTLGQCA